MSHAYVVRPKVDKSGETEKIRYYGVPVTSGQVSTEQLATYISTRCTFSRGEILAAIIEIGREIQFQLDMGYTINLHGMKVCQKAHLLVVYAQSPDFHKLGLCYYLKILYL